MQTQAIIWIDFQRLAEHIEAESRTKEKYKIMAMAEGFKAI